MVRTRYVRFELVKFILLISYNKSDIFMKKETIKVKVDQTKLPNKMHFEVQKTTRAHIQKPKKGKGSFKRVKRVEED